MFVHFGNDVWLLDIHQKKSKKLQNGDPLIYEPGLEELLKKNLKANRLRTVDYKEAIPKSEIVFIAVGTPPKANGEADLSTVLAVSEQIAKNLKKRFYSCFL